MTWTSSFIPPTQNVFDKTSNLTMLNKSIVNSKLTSQIQNQTLSNLMNPQKNGTVGQPAKL